jgi:hypothetical protein
MILFYTELWRRTDRKALWWRLLPFASVLELIREAQARGEVVRVKELKPGDMSADEKHELHALGAVPLWP